MPKFEIWKNYEEQWDKNDIDPPAMVVEARDPSAAAIQFAEMKYVSPDEAAFIVREQGTDKYYEIELEQAWEVDLYKPTTLEELCSP